MRHFIYNVNGRTVPEAVELSRGKWNLTIGRWTGAGAGVWILPPVYCYTEPPWAKLPSSLVCPYFSTVALLNTSWQLLLRKRHTFKSERVRFCAEPHSIASLISVWGRHHKPTDGVRPMNTH